MKPPVCEKTDAGLPAWAELVRAPAEDWSWRQGRLVWKGAKVPEAAKPSPVWRAWFVRHVYANQNSAPSVKAALDRVLAELDAGQWGLDFGAGDRRLHERLLSLDVEDNGKVDVVYDGRQLPFADGIFQVVVSQEVLEHVPDPFAAVREMGRVLAVGGIVYCQLPFQIGYHPCPKDYWRFSHEGIAQLFAQEGWTIEEVGPSLGHGSGFYRIAVEFFAVTASSLSRKLYLPVKALAALCLYPLQWLDGLARHGEQKNRIAGGFYCIARKVP